MKYLIQFIQLSGYVDFCLGELKALLSLFSVDLFQAFKLELKPEIKNLVEIKNSCFENFPFVYIELENEKILETIAERSILINSIQKIFSEGQTHEELIANVKQEEIQPYLDSNDSFRFEYKSNNSTVLQEEKVAIYEKFSKFYFKGKIDLKHPKNKICIIENYNLINDFQKNIKKMYFGVELFKVKNERREQRYCDKFGLSDRIYLGPTSADLYLAFIMVKTNLLFIYKANFALCDQSKFICDFFAEFLVLILGFANYFQYFQSALCFGVEINLNILHGWGVGRTNKASSYYKLHPDDKVNIFTNFVQHGLPLPEIYRFDSTQSNIRNVQLFDALICDPPYGIRAQQQKTKNNDNEEETKKNKEETIEVDYKLTKKYQNEKESNFESEFNYLEKFQECQKLVSNILEQANKYLVKKGRVVMLYPRYKKSPLNIPQHENFTLIDYCENYLSGKHTRYVLTYEKN